MRVAFAFLLAASAFLVLGPPATPACAAGALRLNEILPGPARDWDGSGAFSSRDDEWIEVFNIGPDPCDLAGFFLTDGDSIPRYAFSGTLGPGERRLVFGGDAYDWERATSHPAFGLSLGNGGDAALLWQVAGAETVLVDRYDYGSHEAAADRAIGRVPDGTGEWTLLDGLDPYTGTTPPLGTGCMPTPGTTNVCDGTPTRSVTWGRVKSLYR
jgi:hypothetical protein